MKTCLPLFLLFFFFLAPTLVKAQGKIAGRVLDNATNESLIGVNELPTEMINGVHSLHFSGAIDLGPEFDGLLAGLDEGSEEYVQMKAFFRAFC